MTTLSGPALGDRPNTGGRRDALSRLVRAIDRLQRRMLGIRDFTLDPRCILRLGIVRAPARIELADRTSVERGEKIGALHLWNEQMPQIPMGGPNLAWATRFARAVQHSFRLLARYAKASPEMAGIRAFRGSFPLVYTPATIQLLERLGLELREPPNADTPFVCVTEWFSHRWVWFLRRAFNTESARGLHIGEVATRVVWISRNRLFDVYIPEEHTHDGD